MMYNSECKALGDKQDFELRQCGFDCLWLVKGTMPHELVLCTNFKNLPEQHVEGNAMRKGVVPPGVFRRMFKSHARRRRQAAMMASVAVGVAHEPKPKGKAVGAGGAKD